MSKPRADSWLKTLTEERQAQVIEWCLKPVDRDTDGKPIPKSGGYEYARAQIAADGISVSVHALSDFYSWYHLRQDFAAAENDTQDILDLIRAIDPNLTAQQLEVAGQLVFTKRALRERNQDKFVQMQELDLARKTAATRGRQKEEELQLKKANFQVKTCELFLRWFKDERIRQLADSNVTNAKKIEAMRQIAFADIDELQASGKVVIPK